MRLEVVLRAITCTCASIFVPVVASASLIDGLTRAENHGAIPSDEWHAGTVRMLASESASVNITSLPNELGGNSLSVVNGTFHGIIGFIIFAILGGVLVDCLTPTSAAEKGRPGMWLFGMIGASYVLLVPGILSVLVSYNVFVDLHFTVIFVPFDVAYNMMEEAMTESMASLIHLLFSTGGWLGALLVITYAILLPVVKIGLLVVAERWRFSSHGHRRAMARQSIHFVQVVSKWAAPDMFAYILLLFLLRNLGHPPEVQAAAKLDLGFLCFSIFVVCSTLSTLAIQAPEPLVQVNDHAPPRLHSFVRRAGLAGVVRVVHCLFGLFWILFATGLFVPCMSLRLSVESLLEPNGPVPVSMKEFLLSLQLDEKVHSNVKLWQCMRALVGWAAAGEATCLVASVMILIFVVACTVGDVLLLLLATSDIRTQDRHGELQKQRIAIRAAWVLNHVAMLDVFCMGVVVVCWAGAAYKSMGIELEMRSGIWYLLAAEVAHLAMYQVVKAAVDYSAADLQPDATHSEGDKKALLSAEDPQE